MRRASAHRWMAMLIAVAFLWAAAQGAALAQARSALVIGNNAYAFAPLVNPTNDAADVTRTLREAGFSVTTLIDADRLDELVESDGRHTRAINIKRRGTAPLADLVRVHALAIVARAPGEG